MIPATEAIIEGFKKQAVNYSRIGSRALLRSVSSAKMVPVGFGTDLEARRVSKAVADKVRKQSPASIVAGGGFPKSTKIASEKNCTGGSTLRKSSDMMGQTDFNKIASEAFQDGAANAVALREKVASTMLQLSKRNKEHEKRAQATRVLFRQAELGLSAVPMSYDEYEEKIASIVNQGDLDVLEKAMELTAGSARFGDLNVTEKTANDAAATFQADVLGW